ncbi:MAG: A24 family peptidase [Phycisphaeraceae bacterium]
MLEAEWIEVVPWMAVVGGALVAAVTDCRTRRIRNVLTFPLLLAGLIFGGVVGGVSGLGSALLGMLVLGVPFVVLFVVASGGAGDAKLMGAIGAWLGVGPGLPVLAAVFIWGGVMGIVYAVYKRQAGQVGRSVAMLGMGTLMAAASRGRNTTALHAAQAMPGSGMRMPYGLAILAGVLTGGVWTWL